MAVEGVGRRASHARLTFWLPSSGRTLSLSEGQAAETARCYDSTLRVLLDNL